MQRDDYGQQLNNYIHFTQHSMEEELGRKAAIKRFGHSAKGSVIEVGCNAAINSHGLRAVGFNSIVGVDVDAAAIVAARQIDPEGEYFHYDGINLADVIGQREFDAAFLSFVVCVLDAEKLLAICSDLRKLMKTGGKLMIADQNTKAFGRRYGKQLHYHAQPGLKNGDYTHVTLGYGAEAVELYHDIYWELDYVLKLLKNVGFSIEKVEYPRPKGLDIIRLWPATLVPPYVVVTATAS